MTLFLRGKKIKKNKGREKERATSNFNGFLREIETEYRIFITLQESNLELRFFSNFVIEKDRKLGMIGNSIRISRFIIVSG